MVAKIARSAAAAVAGVRAQLDLAAVRRRRRARSPRASRIDCYGVGATSCFMATDLQARLFRLGCSANAGLDYHLQLVVGRRASAARGVVIAITHVGGMPSLLDAVDIARAQGATVIALTQPGTPLAERSPTSCSASSVPDDAVMHVGIDAYLTHLTVIEILTVLVAQRLRRPGRAAPARRARRSQPRHRHAHHPRLLGRAATTATAVRDHARHAARKRPRRRRQRRRRRWPGDVLLVGDRIAAVGAGLRTRLPEAWRSTTSTCSTAPAWRSHPASSTSTPTTTPSCCDDPDMLPKLSQGITTVVTGNCGISLVPYVTDSAAARR